MELKTINDTFEDSYDMIEFEKEIAYFYGASNPEKMAEHYIKALIELENIGIETDQDLLEMAMIDPLIHAYQEVKIQTQLDFNVKMGAFHEFRLICAQANGDSFDKIYSIMMDLYQEVFNTSDIRIHKAAMLRTFLYKYKMSLMGKNGTLSPDDRNLISTMAKASEKELNSLG